MELICVFVDIVTDLLDYFPDINNLWRLLWIRPIVVGVRVLAVEASGGNIVMECFVSFGF